jgi:hypothetical protein
MNSFFKKASSIFSFSTTCSKPLGRWSQCGDKKCIENIVEFKIRQKQRRQYLLETGTDPYRINARLDIQDKRVVQHGQKFLNFREYRRIRHPLPYRK